MKMIKGKYFAVVIWVFSFTFGALVLLIMSLSTENLSTSYCGFAVDQDNNLYIGRNTAICVIPEEGDEIRTIDPQTNRGYKFTIENNTLYVEEGTYLYTMDLEGNILKEREEYYSLDHSKTPKFYYRRYTADDGTLYVMRNPWLRPTIYRISAEQRIKIFEMPRIEYIAKLIYIAMFLSGFIVIPLQVIPQLGCLSRLSKELCRRGQFSATLLKDGVLGAPEVRRR